ncbi:TPA: hypothetical protein EYP66_19905 [Candidatus Poribacteria bacterium]|nr:hypothetical protein [Candidatus Poribacteria bacterium]
MSIVTIELQSKQYEAIMEIASQEKKSEHQICLEAIEEYLERKEKLAKGRAALLKLGKGLGKGPRELADKHDEYLYGKEPL